MSVKIIKGFKETRQTMWLKKKKKSLLGDWEEIKILFNIYVMYK